MLHLPQKVLSYNRWYHPKDWGAGMELKGNVSQPLAACLDLIDVGSLLLGPLIILKFQVRVQEGT